MFTQNDLQKNAREFAEYWANKGDEKQESQRFWIDLLQNVIGVVDATKIIDFEKRVKIGATKYIDGYIAETKTIIEQKGAKIDLRKAERQSDGSELTPFEQAKRYNDNLPFSERARWIVVSNFTEIHIHDMEKVEPEKDFETIFIKDLAKDFYRLQFLVDAKNENIRREEELSIEAGKRVDKLYKAILPQYIEQNEISLRSLNILCVRIVFCLYAEDAGLFATRTAFEDYIKSFNLQNVRIGLINLFKALDTKIENRDKYDEALTPFPYVNGGLFRDESIEIPNFTQEIVDVICNDCAVFNWSEISPTIFGAVFESTLNPETRRKGGMHYTSIQNIHKVIAPLFLDSLKAELAAIKAITSLKEKREAIKKYQDKIASLKFLDPACGSGNFLTESYLSLAQLEIEALEATKDTGEMFVNGQAKVDISQFFGIEINDFAVTVAKTALWIAESQVNERVNEILQEKKEFLPLTTNAFIVEGNALRMDWATLTVADGFVKSEDELDLFSGFYTQIDGTKHEYNYIMGNPPFVGFTYMTDEQKKDMDFIFPKVKNLDFVCAWYKKASDLIQGTNIKCAFVSTNSITQGETVGRFLPFLNVQYDFAYRTFKWDSESTEKAHVHCVIVGFSYKKNCHTDSILLTQNQDKSTNGKSLDFPNPCGNKKRIFNADGTIEEAENINGYLLNAPNIIVESRNKPLCDIPQMVWGNKPADGGFLIIEEEDYDEFVKKDPNAKKYIRPLLGAVEFLHNKNRYCLWLEGVSPAEIKKCPLIFERVKKCKETREKSVAAAIRKFADTPHLFAQRTQPIDKDFILVPNTSSERRKYVPMSFIKAGVVTTNATSVIPDATLYHFGVLTSSVHMAWMRAVCGRLKSDYRYSKDIVYNNFPWCAVSDEQKEKIEKTAQAILDERAKYPDSSLADLYDETLMPAELRKAHRENDKAVMKAYGFKADMSEAEIVAELFKMYEELTAKAK